MEQRISIERLEQAVNIFGSFDENIRLLEKEFNVTVTNRDGELRISGIAVPTLYAVFSDYLPEGRQKDSRPRQEVDGFLMFLIISSLRSV